MTASIPNDRGQAGQYLPVDIEGLEAQGYHEIDFDDVFLTREIVIEVGEVAWGLIRSRVPGRWLTPELMADVVQGFPQRAFWLDASGALVLEADIIGQYHAFVIPSGQWGVRDIPVLH